MILPVTLTIAAAAAVLNLWLAMRIVRGRFQTKVMTGDGGDAMMLGRMRAQANFIEYAPFVLILMALIELAGGSATVLWGIGAVFVAARIAHGLGMGGKTPNILRAAGALVTWAVLAGLAGWALALVYYGYASPVPTGVITLDATVRG
ncbi:GST-like protein [Sphingomonas sp. Leaf17]|uniref:MAPEG family protein n=1 Tax=Sphingomonas sp. Leaf17 TaxID=1735683 RepID=UPI0006F46CF6|nr:MAPEG family protein [Sphingomonas sp. Leaf17]KQM64398.1 GST-like protein [Sphingomonas sp. Leaf17]